MKLTEKEIEQIEGWLGVYLAESSSNYDPSEDEKLIEKIKKMEILDMYDPPLDDRIVFPNKEK
jgi:hypothetical protein